MKLVTILFLLILVVTSVFSQTATSVSGLYNTGISTNGSLLATAAQDPSWTVTYASTNGGANAATAYEGISYVIDPNVAQTSKYTPNTSNAQWITAPGAVVDGSTRPNRGGDFLPGNGNSGANEGIYIYKLTFNIAGSGSPGTVVTNGVSIQIAIAADDQYSIYVNPQNNSNGSINKTISSPSVSTLTSAWNNTEIDTLQNYGSNNAVFVIGTNTIEIEVDNTNTINGPSNSNAWNASGLLVYQSSADWTVVGPKPVVPELSTFIMVGVMLAGGAGAYYIKYKIK
jgi:hypothetical protein